MEFLTGMNIVLTLMNVGMITYIHTAHLFKRGDSTDRMEVGNYDSGSDTGSDTGRDTERTLRGEENDVTYFS